MEKLSFKKLFLILIIFFIISIIPRFSNLNRPLSWHHEWITSTALRHIQIWYEDGIVKHNFNPMITYPGSVNRHISDIGLSDKQGNFYYISYPPFGYILPFLTFKTLSIYPSVLAIQIYNLFLNFISGLFIFLILRILCNKNNLASLAGYVLYIFAPVTMWFQSNVYMSDMAVQPLFIIGLYLFLKITKDKGSKNIYLYLIGLVNFLMIYTEWIGVFFAFTAFIYCLLNIKKEKVKKLLIIIIISSALPLMLTAFQYSLIAGPEQLLSFLRNRYAYRSGIIGYGENSNYNAQEDNIFSSFSWIKILDSYWVSVAAMLILFSTLFIWTRKLKTKFENNYFFWAMCIVPVLIHHLVFFNFTAVHDFSVLKSAVFLSLACGYLISKIKINNKTATILAILILVATVYSVITYRAINSDYSMRYKIAGETIKAVARDNESVFLNYGYGEPLFDLYAHRNISRYGNDEWARKIINLNGANRGIVFVLDEYGVLINNAYYINK